MYIYIYVYTCVYVCLCVSVCVCVCVSVQQVRVSMCVCVSAFVSTPHSVVWGPASFMEVRGRHSLHAEELPRSPRGC